MLPCPLQELQGLVRHIEMAVRSLQQQQQQQEAAAGDGAPDSAAFLQTLSEAVDTFSHSVGYAIAVKQLAGGPAAA